MEYLARVDEPVIKAKPNCNFGHVSGSCSWPGTGSHTTLSLIPPISLAPLAYFLPPGPGSNDPYDIRETHTYFTPSFLLSITMSTRGRKQANGSSSSSEPTNSIDQNENTTSSVVGLLKTPSVDVQREEVKVNNASVTDMKHACDDALKRVSTVMFRVYSGLSLRGLHSVLSCPRTHPSCIQQFHDNTKY